MEALTPHIHQPGQCPSLALFRGVDMTLLPLKSTLMQFSTTAMERGAIAISGLTRVGFQSTDTSKRSRLTSSSRVCVRLIDLRVHMLRQAVSRVACVRQQVWPYYQPSKEMHHAVKTFSDRVRWLLVRGSNNLRRKWVLTSVALTCDFLRLSSPAVVSLTRNSNQALYSSID